MRKNVGLKVSVLKLLNLIGPHISESNVWLNDVDVKCSIYIP